MEPPLNHNPADWRPTRQVSHHQPPAASHNPADAISPPTSPETPQLVFNNSRAPPPDVAGLGFSGQYSNPGHTGPSTPGYFPPVQRNPADTGYDSTPPTPWGAFPQTPSPRYGFHNRGDSQNDLLDPFQQEASRQNGQYPRRNPNLFVRAWVFYQRSWTQSWTMGFFLFCGIMFAIGHHLFYAGLDGQLARDQMRKRRYGTALAFLAKASLVTAVILAFRQRAWMMVRRKILSLGAVDSLFAAAEDLSALFNWEALRRAKLAMLLAAYIWCTPLIIILTSETLTVVPTRHEENTTCLSVRTLNFSHEETMDWRAGVMLGGIYENSVSLWNTTMPDGKAGDPDWFDYWTESSQQFKTVAYRAAYLQKPVMKKHSPAEICSSGWNCSYVINFVGPGYQCTELAKGVGKSTKKLNGQLPRFNTSDILPEGGFSYIAITDEGEYPAQLADVEPGGAPKHLKKPYSTEFGAFKTEPIVWVGYAQVEDLSKLQPVNRTTEGWNTSYVPTIFGCEHHEMNYTVELNYTNGMQNYEILKKKSLGRIIDTRFVRGKKDNSDGSWDNVTATPSENFVLARDIENYRRTAAYHSIGKQMRRFINGTISMPYYIANTDLISTRLNSLPNYLPVDDFQNEVEAFYEEIILSMLSNPSFISVSWASDPSSPSGPLVGDNSTRYKCKRSRIVNTYKYHFTELWIVYSISIAMAIGAVVAGWLAIRELGSMRDTKFSSIVAATRAQSLNRVRWDQEKDIKSLKVGFGLVPGYSGEKTHGFGFEGDVTQDKPKIFRSPALQMMDWGSQSVRRRSRQSGFFEHPGTPGAPGGSYEAVDGGHSPGHLGVTSPPPIQVDHGDTGYSSQTTYSQTAYGGGGQPGGDGHHTGSYGGQQRQA
ncbi:hypothetical protein B0T10DRAFT_483755 [Thelonectria olida]|uniref:Formylmethionine deformylase-like protein n=1 Tax=Thelonectria olida TaxID=1576542 RepID=A0A9P9AS87_9HYPO|nr:hypothetical protein B0T10DRAFT_483755 [Thelonectria olida]